MSLDYNDPVIFDLETSSPDPYECEIIQIAALAPLSNDKFEIKLTFDELKADKEALEKNSYSQEIWGKKALPITTALNQFSEFLEDHASQQRISKRGNTFHVALGMGYNILRFDMILIQKYFTKYKLFLSMDFRPFDVMQLALWNLPGLESYSLKSIAEHLNCYQEGAHDAMVDVEITADVASLLLYDETRNNNLKWVKRRIRRMNR